ncbi:short chain dehydrogenase [Mycolicibacterium mageritense DSM 44476 = CIP 104973]|uniref:Short chain dehydrogenase n=1 Tax=Mycolicibacterium mageritense TaxID=53462 RepID=A0ABM7I108_MYCME|nr:SDR family oxidoreductase [Mycolicibacterium mageritense]MCC9186032.1 SDR family oxidoreductase [Mycolicibacterium mageritense]BBX36571.1 short chain dehydrogenase [Mycolicibacterium mageritense]GJJ21915.1 short chain dehydrogenase [Mycolicibacterium mageritense]CDO24675.1 short chain dehydrogenase [Mycolicibacterium mageritense DSM 44476 = CIP 104973]
MQVALVTGASRGIGAEVAAQLGAAGVHVVVNYREKVKRANAIVDAITAAGGQGSVAGADLSDPVATAGLIDQLRDSFGRLDVLVLNASGGLERGADADYPMRINRDAQVRLVELALPLLSRGGRIVFVTSHQAHFHGQQPVPQDYLPIAASKRAGEDALRAMQPRFDELGISFVVVSGDMIDGTIIVRLLARRDPEAVSARTIHGELPTIEEFARAIVTAALDPTRSTDTVYVGGADYVAAATG